MGCKALFAGLLAHSLVHAAEPPIQQLKLPPGFKVSLYAYPVPDARSLAQGPGDVVFVGNRAKGSIYALVPGQPAKVLTIGTDLNMPNGVAFKGKDLYVAEVSRVLIFKNIDIHHPGKPQAWGPAFPDKTHHGWKFIAFGPDGWLYVPVGAPCNVCEEDPRMFAALHKISPDGGQRELVAQGIRNTVGFDWAPDTRHLWFTDNGRDWLGDDKPPDELNEISQAGENFGFPRCHGKALPDPEFNKGERCAQFTAPKHEFPAHSAALGLRFIRNNKGLRNSILVAEHGSWNRSTPVGYQLTRLRYDNGKITGAEPFLTGFLSKEGAWGRPVDVLELKDGSILVSDDTAGAVYKITYEGK